MKKSAYEKYPHLSDLLANVFGGFGTWADKQKDEGETPDYVRKVMTPCPNCPRT